MADFIILLGNKNYSSWSLRGWLLLERCGVPFEEVVIPLRQPDTRQRILEKSPSGKVPTLIIAEGGATETVWDSLAIAECLAERFPDAGLWPADRKARTRARCLCAEMHAGFQALRGSMPMDMRRVDPAEGARLRQRPGVEEDIARIVTIWEETRRDFGGGSEAGKEGPFLFGGFGAADAFFAPVASRFASYGVALGGEAKAYAAALLDWPATRRWAEAGRAESWTIEFPELR